MIVRRVTVSGRVQGVGFRWHARQIADQLGVFGWVRNSFDGSVEVHVEGDEDAVEAFLGWLGHGPAAAHVTAVNVAPAAPIHTPSFAVTR